MNKRTGSKDPVLFLYNRQRIQNIYGFAPSGGMKRRKGTFVTGTGITGKKFFPDKGKRRKRGE
jgi:hypothetical protein